jgi:hypothetical protein
MLVLILVLVLVLELVLELELMLVMMLMLMLMLMLLLMEIGGCFPSHVAIFSCPFQTMYLEKKDLSLHVYRGSEVLSF